MWRKLIEINVTGAFFIAQACGRQMIKQGRGGSIVLVASMSGSIVNYPQEQCCYNASKAAVIQLTRSLAAEWAKHSIRVNSISPGYMDTELNRVPALEAQKQIWVGLTPLKRLGDEDEMNNLAVFLASDASSFVTGSNIIADVSHSLDFQSLSSLIIIFREAILSTETDGSSYLTSSDVVGCSGLIQISPAFCDWICGPLLCE